MVGEVRVQPLGRHLVRIEQRGPNGFEDRETFTVRERGSEAVEARETRAGGAVCIATATYRVVVPAGAAGLEGIRVESPAGEALCVLSNALLAKTFLPAPSALPAVWVLGDHPRDHGSERRLSHAGPAAQNDEVAELGAAQHLIDLRQTEFDDGPIIGPVHAIDDRARNL